MWNSYSNASNLSGWNNIYFHNGAIVLQYICYSCMFWIQMKSQQNYLTGLMSTFVCTRMSQM
uniref:Uncharacterized protein n=1 Tax=Arundo donax TaxID=35708 RepID=A0A0A9HRA3_ARUDO